MSDSMTYPTDPTLETPLTPDQAQQADLALEELETSLEDAQEAVEQLRDELAAAGADAETLAALDELEEALEDFEEAVEDAQDEIESQSPSETEAPPDYVPETVPPEPEQSIPTETTPAPEQTVPTEPTPAPEQSTPTPEPREEEVLNVTYESRGGDHVDTATVTYRDEQGEVQQRTVDVETRDTDGSGHADTGYADLDGDGVSTVVGVDNDNDGVFDTVDSNADGVTDGGAIQAGEDRTADGELQRLSGETEYDSHIGGPREVTVENGYQVVETSEAQESQADSTIHEAAAGDPDVHVVDTDGDDDGDASIVDTDDGHDDAPVVDTDDDYDDVSYTSSSTATSSGATDDEA